MEGAGATLPVHEGLGVDIDFVATANYAMQQNDVPLVRSITIQNRTGRAFSGFKIRLWTDPPVIEPVERIVDLIDSGKDVVLRDVRPTLLRKALLAVTERVAGQVHVQITCDGAVVGSRSEPLAILAFNEWIAYPPLPELTAAFVMPNDPAVEKILGAARQVLLGAGDRDGALSGYQSGDSKKAWGIAAAIYQAIGAFGIGYVVPPASFEKTGQKVRTPSQILDAKLATCLDLTFLYAACCEQAGLNPLVTFLKGHAFAGVWLLPERLRTGATDDASLLRKRIDLHEMLGVELTGLCRPQPLPFVQAIDEARKRLADDGEFERSIDVGMARAAGIRPLPLSQRDEEGENESGGASPASVLGPEGVPALPSGWRPPDLFPEPSVDGAAEAETPDRRLERWKHRLLDLTLRNRLLNFKETKKAIPILCPSLAKLEDGLAGGSEFRLLPNVSVGEAEDPRNPVLFRERTGQDVAGEFLAQELDLKRIHASLSQAELDARLIELYRATHLSLEEGGANTLFLALGFLKWYEKDESDQALKAPILLVPMAVERSSLRDGFRLRQADEDARINVTLLKRLEQQGIVIPDLDPLPEDESGLDVPKILARIRTAVVQQRRWDVLEDAALCTLTFTKFLMWVDLEQNAALLKQNDVVRHLVDTPNQPFQQAPFPEERSLDDVMRPAETWCPVDADSSQLAAILSSAEGRSFVLQGPPGTGKSQTITNLIAHEMALGRRVLFVSEKMAALNVVHSRLEKVGLGAFCLEAHSTKASKDALRKQLKEILESPAEAPVADWEIESKRLEELRRELNVYAAALHDVRPCGRTAFQAIATLIQHRDLPEVQLDLGALAAVDRERLGRMRSAASTLQRMAEEAKVSPAHPLRPVRIRQWRLSLAAEVRAAAAEAKDRAGKLKEACRAPMEMLGMPVDGSRDDIGLAVKLLGLLATSPSPTPEMMLQSGWSHLKAALEGWIGRGRERDSARAKLMEGWNESFLEADHAAVLAILGEASTAWFLKSWLLRRRVGKFLAPHRRDGKAPDAQVAGNDLRAAGKVRTESAALSDGVSDAARMFGGHWRRGEADWDGLAALLAWTERYRSELAQAEARSPGRAAGSGRRWVMLASEQADLFRQEGNTHAQAERFLAAVKECDRTVETLRMLLDLDLSLAWGDDGSPGYLERIASSATVIADSADGLQLWCAYRAAEREAAEVGLGPLALEVAEGKIRPDQVELSFEKSFAAWLIRACQAVSPVLADFHGFRHGIRIEDFRKLDVRLRDLTRAAIRARLFARLPKLQTNGNVVRTSETGKLQRFVQGGRSSIRKLFLECPNVLAVYKPCVLMSPLSVAQFLGKGFPPFDVVVFDEASQMPVWEAVGAIARGKRLIVVGDSKQLPPTSFFDRKGNEDEVYDEEDVVEEESILDECVAAQIPFLSLKWHYRSRHESLIAFSNRQYYEDKLLTFPGAVAESPRLGVIWREVPDGVYEGGGTRTNKKEAEQVVAEVVRRLTDPAEEGRSIGIVTFSLAQQKLVEDLLERARGEHPEIDRFFTRELEPVFVKNLETVQGDERDVILFSICYGPDAAARVALRFGPLNLKGGERRLNVAITRARQQLVVFSTLRPDHIDLGRTKAVGVAHLKAFLDYAKRGPVALQGEAALAVGASCESPFEEAVLRSLEAKGWTVHKQVGCSGYRIDLAVVDPEYPGRYVLGIECDGANYHSSRTARDRDRLRASVLGELGWQLHRIWSTDWWVEPGRQLEKAEVAIREAVEKSRFTPPAAPAPTAAPAVPIATAPQPAVPREPEAEQGPPPPEVAVPYSVFACPPLQSPGDPGYAAYTGNGDLGRCIADVVVHEGPIALELLARRVSVAWGAQRISARLVDRVRMAVPANSVTLRRYGARTFAWPKALDPSELKVFRYPAGPDTERGAEEICPEEVALASRYVLAAHFSLEREDLLRETARQFGFLRVGVNVRASLEEGIDHLVRTDRATTAETMVTLRRE